MAERSLARRVGGNGLLTRMGAATIDDIASWHAEIERATDTDLIDVYRLAGEIGKRAWVIQAHCLAVAKRKKLHHNDGGVRAVADLFGLSPSQASALIRVWDTWGEKFLQREAPSDRVIGVSWYKTAAYTAHPDEWLDHIERRHQENPSYRVQDLRWEISRAVEEGDGTPPPPEPTLLGPREGRAALKGLASASVAILGGGPLPRQAPEEAARAEEAREALVIAKYHELVGALESAARGTGAFVFKVEPDRMAELLGPIDPDEKLKYQLLDNVASWLKRTNQYRRGVPPDAPRSGED